jgi:hypothetical protein
MGNLQRAHAEGDEALCSLNALNHANFNVPGRIFGAANFVITSAQDPRELQIALKVAF